MVYTKKLTIQFMCSVHSLRTFAAFSYIVTVPLRAVLPAVPTPPGAPARVGAWRCTLSQKSWTHHTRLHWPHRTWWPLALLPAAVRAAPGVPQRRDREPAARHALPRPGAGRGGECAWRSAALQHPCPCRPAGKGPGRAQYRVQTAVYVKRQSG